MKKKLNHPLEKDIQKSVLDWLKYNNIFHYKNSTTGIYKQSTGSYIPSQSVGSPDIVIVIRGRYIGCELKRGGGKQSEYQKEFEGRLRNAGGYYILAHSLERSIEQIQQIQKELTT